MGGRGILLFSVFGIDVKIDWSWVIIALLIAWSLAHGYFPSISEGLPQAAYWGMGLGALVGLFASIVLHELAHSLVARRLGLPIHGITLFIFGGVAEMDAEPAHPRVEILMAIAGPVVSLVLAALLTAAGGAADAAGAAATGVVLRYLGSLNLILALFNLVPAFPLDGGRVLRGALWWATGDFHRATRWAATCGLAFGGVLIAVGFLAILGGEFLAGMWWVLIGFFLSGAAQSSQRELELREALGGVTVRRVMTAEPIAVPPDLSVAALIEDFVYRHHHKLFPVVEDGRLVGSVSTREAATVPRERWGVETVAAILTPCGAEGQIGPDEAAIDALARMQSHGISRLMVVEGGRLVGIVALSDVMRILSIRLDLAATPAGR